MKILITYQYFLPAFKVGGPIQSIANICRTLGGAYDFYIICSDVDKNGEELDGITRGTWNIFEKGTAKVYYLTSKEQTRKRLNELIAEVKPDLIFVNGLYSPLFSVYPLAYRSARKVISVRGMLHSGALSQKSFKKKLFIAGLKALRLHNGCVYHATDVAEKAFIEKVFGTRTKVFVAQNFPKTIEAAPVLPKRSGTLKLVSIAMISPMKNILLVIEALTALPLHIEYDIYGSVKDDVYWKKCLEEAAKSTTVKITYKGELLPENVLPTLGLYHFLVLPSKSENFGHAFFEALASGKPVITSHNTPWNNLKENKAGYNVSIDDTAELKGAISAAYNMSGEEYNEWSRCSRKYAVEKVNIEKTTADYKRMFEI